MEEELYDYAIIGGGLAGLQLALSFNKDSFFNDKRIAIIEPDTKDKNDKTWCYWEKGKGDWDHLNSFSWNKGEILSQNKELKLNMDGFSYKMIKSIDFYNYAKKILTDKSNFKRINDSCEKLIELNGEFEIQTSSQKIRSKVVFDSRIDKKAITNTSYPSLSQHFKGWIIETEDDTFEEGVFRMMDFRLTYNNSCCFTYVLPFCKNEALVEFTFFDNNKIEEKVYDDLLKKYIESYLNTTIYKIKESEKGIIPMSSYPFHEGNTSNYMRIGTAGGWVKASSGYSFKRTTEKVARVRKNIIEGKKLDYQIFNNRFMFYDRLFLSVLQNHNNLGNQIFERMYTSIKASLTFDFLDEKTNFFQELQIMKTFNKPLFIKAILKEYF